MVHPHVEFANSVCCPFWPIIYAIIFYRLFRVRVRIRTRARVRSQAYCATVRSAFSETILTMKPNTKPKFQLNPNS